LIGGLVVSSKKFKGALQQIPMPGGKQRAFLRFHEESKARALTVTMLGDKVGYKSYHAVNLLYGKLAKQIGEELGISNRGLSLLCDFFKPGELTNEHWVLVMRPEFAEGLKQAKWI
jgi:hypothetical protein